MRARRLGWLLGAGLAAGACSVSPQSMGFSGTGNRSGGSSGTGGGVGDLPDAGPTILPAAPSTGCGMAASQALDTYVEHPITIGIPNIPTDATNRIYYVRLPASYDPNKAYRTIYLGPGCGAPQDLQPSLIKVYPMETVTMGEAILIAMEPGLYNAAHYNAANCATNQNSPCQYCFDDGADATTANSVEYPYFEALHQEIEASYCVDKNRQFYAGYSSGGWMAQQLGCRYPDVLRAQGNVTGGLPPVIKNGTETCVDHPIAAFLIHDYNDTSNVYAGSVAALERLLRLNHCAGGKTMATATTAPYMIDGIANTAMFSCLQYTGCPVDYPIVFCTSTNQAHGSQSSSAVPGFWGFFSQF